MVWIGASVSSVKLLQNSVLGIHYVAAALFIFEKNRGGQAIELVAPIEAGNLKDEEEAEDRALAFVNKISRSFCRATSGNDVVNNQDFLSLLDSILLHLEEVGTILLNILGCDARTGKLSLLAYGSESHAESEGKAGAEKETPGIETNDDIGHASSSSSLLTDLHLQGIKQSSMRLGICEQGHDVNELDARNWEVLEGA